MVLEMLEFGVEVIDLFPVFQKYKEDGLFSYEHNISPEGAQLTAKVIADYVKKTSMNKSWPDVGFSSSQNDMWYYPWQTNAPERHVRKHLETCIRKEGAPYLPFGTSSNIGIFGNCNLQAYLYRGSGIAANLAYELQRDVDYLGRKLIFGSEREAYDMEIFEKSAKKDIVICISFPSGSFVRTSALDRGMVKRMIRYGIHAGRWSTTDLGDL